MARMSPASRPALPAFLFSSMRAASLSALSSKVSRTALRCFSALAAASACSVRRTTEVAPPSSSARASRKVRGGPDITRSRHGREGSVLLLFLFLVIAATGVLEFLHALAQATHELGDLLSPEEQEDHHNDEDDVPGGEEGKDDRK